MAPPGGASSGVARTAAAEAAQRAAERGPTDVGAWERLGRLRLGLLDREGSLQAFDQALKLGANGEVHNLVAQALALEPRMSQTV